MRGLLFSAAVWLSIYFTTDGQLFTPTIIKKSLLDHVVNSKWDCSGLKPFSMETNFIHNKSVTEEVFQEWLTAYQSDCSREKCDLTKVHSAGIGSSINDAVMKFGICLGQGRIYKPEGEWLWASSTERCGNGLKSLDCYFQVITSCKSFGQKLATLPKNSTAMNFINSSGNSYSTLFQPSHTSVCALAATGRIPVVAVFGHLIKYITRMDEKLSNDVASHIQDIYSHAKVITESNVELAVKDVLGTKLKYIAAHIRRGDPDGGRRQVSIEEYMTKINLQLQAFQPQQIQTIDFIYMSGDNINANVNISDIKTTNRIILPSFINTGKGEQEHHVRSNQTLKETLVIEYMVDLFMYSGAQGYIGVHSNIWAVIYSIRVATGYRNSCMFDTHMLPYHYTCDTCEENFWKPAFKLSCS